MAKPAARTLSSWLRVRGAWLQRRRRHGRRKRSPWHERGLRHCSLRWSQNCVTWNLLMPIWGSQKCSTLRKGVLPTSNFEGKFVKESFPSNLFLWKGKAFLRNGAILSSLTEGGHLHHGHLAWKSISECKWLLVTIKIFVFFVVKSVWLLVQVPSVIH